MKKALIFVVGLLSLWAVAQEPSYFKIGEEELAGIHIYDLLQDQDKNYWIATDNGLYLFDHYTFRQLSCDEMSSSSIFNLCENEQGEVFCNNLSGQIFQVSANHELALFYQIPDSLMFHEISVEIDNRNELVVCSGVLFSVSKQKEIEILLRPEKSFAGGMYKDEEGGLNFHSTFESQMNRLYQGKIEKAEKLDVGCRPTLVALNGERFIFDRISGQVVSHTLQDKVLNYHANVAGAIYYTDHEKLWVASRKGGVHIFDKHLNQEFEGKKVLNDFFISSFLKDHEGNYVLGTFGDGIVVVPSLITQEINMAKINEKATQIEVGKNGTLFIGCQSGKVFQLLEGGGLRLLSDRSTKSIEYLELLASRNVLIFDGLPDEPTLSVNLNDYTFSSFQLLALKDIKSASDRKYIVANNSGCFWFDLGGAACELIETFDGRTNCVAIEEEEGLIYSGSSAGLLIGNEQKSENFLLDGSPIICSNITYHQGKVLIASKKNGVLVFDNGNLVDEWNSANGFPENEVFHIVPYGEQFVVGTASGIYICDEGGSATQKLGEAIGFVNSKPLDMEIYNHNLYAVFLDGIKIVDLSKLDPPNFQPSVQLTEWTINDTNQSFANNQLKPHQNKVTFSLNSKTLKYASELRYYYRLEGVDQSWQSNDFEENNIEYKSLSPGDYKFHYYAQYEENKSDVSVFEFRVETPFYQTIWFIVLIVLSSVILALLIFYYQISRKQKIDKYKREIVESKLTAIQSQMNPHFIFNSLNSIQDLVLNQQGESAYNYISKFAFLVRKVLHYSEIEFIHIEDELKVLMVYLELEQLRFDHEFEFDIDFNIEEDVEIPPMIIQPFVENAIKHGLLHKEGSKKLNLRFGLAEHLLYCEIEDNGVGREKSKEINERKKRNYESFSTNSIQDRFEILKNIHGGDLGVVYEDKYQDGKAVGTIVKLQIPVRRNH